MINNFLIGLVLFLCSFLWMPILAQETPLINNKDLHIQFLASEKGMDRLANWVLNCYAEIETVLGYKPNVRATPIYFTLDRLPPSGHFSVCLSSYMSREECLYKIIQALILRDFCPKEVDEFNMLKVSELDWLIAGISHKILHGNLLNQMTHLPHPYRLYRFYRCQSPFDIQEWIGNPLPASPLAGYKIYSLNSLYLARFLRVKIAPDAIFRWIKEWSTGKPLEVVNELIFYNSAGSIAQRKIVFNLQMRAFLFMNASVTNEELEEIVNEIEDHFSWCHSHAEQEEMIGYIKTEIKSSVGNLALNSTYNLETQKDMGKYRNAVFRVCSDLNNRKYQKNYEKELKKIRKQIAQQKKISQWLTEYEITTQPNRFNFIDIFKTEEEICQQKKSNKSIIQQYLEEVEKKLENNGADGLKK